MQHLGCVAVADRHRHVPVAVLVEHDVARPRIGERPRGDGVEALAPELELDLRARDDAHFGHVLPRDVESDVAERVNIEDRARDPVPSDLRLRNVESDERVGSKRRAELVDGTPRAR